MGIASGITIEKVTSEKSLLLRVTSIVQLKDPDALVSWDTQGGGLGYLIERGIALGKPIDGNDGMVPSVTKIDMARLLGRTPKSTSLSDSPAQKNESNVFGMQDDGEQDKEESAIFGGSGLGTEWDDRVGAGAAAASIVSSHELH